MQNVRCIRETIQNLTQFAPQMIGEDLRSRWSRENTAQEQWATQIVELFCKFEDDIISATIAYEDAVFFPTETEEEEK